MLRALPAGLAIDPAVMNEFLDPPAALGEWFARKAYVTAAQAIELDSAVTFDEYKNVQDLFKTAIGGLQSWTEMRDASTSSKGYGMIPYSMQLRGAEAVRAINEIADTAKELAAKAHEDTAATLHEFAAALWSYVGCMGLEYDASAARTPVLDLLNHFDSTVQHPWQSAMTPQSLSRTWTPPPAETSTTSEGWGGSETGTGDTHAEDPASTDPPEK